ncbi:MAG: AraC family transcriptional regulator [Acidobacteria bacterium]|nr:AraC family transcriptional regulator [Acidobacteriota bacterium]
MDYRIKAITKFIKENLDSNISLQELSKIGGQNYSYMSTLFKKETGKTFSEYLMLFRIRYSKSLLRHSTKEIKEISFLVGYKSVQRFYSNFQKYVGYTPKQYRDKFNQYFFMKLNEEFHNNQNDE